jgi:hypothetical protein
MWGKSAPLKQTWKQPLGLNIKFYYTIHVKVGFHQSRAHWGSGRDLCRLESRKTCTSYIDLILSALLLNYCAEDVIVQHSSFFCIWFEDA